MLRRTSPLQDALLMSELTNQFCETLLTLSVHAMQYKQGICKTRVPIPLSRRHCQLGSTGVMLIYIPVRSHADFLRSSGRGVVGLIEYQ